MTKVLPKLPAPVWLGLILLPSCATVLNGPVQRVAITTDNKVKVLSVENATYIDSTWMGPEAPRYYYIPRSDKPVAVKVSRDTGISTLYLHPHNSVAFWANLYFNYGIGMLVDRDNKKRFSYPSKNYLTARDTIISNNRFAPVKKGTMDLTLSLPFVNDFNIRTPNGPYRAASVLGLAGGLDYFYRDNHYLSLVLGVANDRGIWDRVIYKGYFQTGNVAYASVRNNHVIGSFDLGYGINLSRFRWTKTTAGDTIAGNQAAINTGLGLSFSAQYRFGNYFRLGVQYQPNLVNLRDLSTYNYQHYISLDLVCKFRINRPKP